MGGGGYNKILIVMLTKLFPLWKRNNSINSDELFY